MQRLLRVNLDLVPMPPKLRPTQIDVLGGPTSGRVVIGLQLPDGAVAER